MHSSRFRPKLLALSFALCVLTAASPVAFAQVDRAVLEGTVTDPSGGVIVGAKVNVLAVDTGLSQEQATNSKGYYRFPGLAVGVYQVTTNGEGFKTNVIQDVVLRVGQTRTVDVQLAVGAINEKIEVNANLTPADRVSAEA